jgi:hypothetical protein
MKFVEKMKAYILSSKPFFPENMENVIMWKNMIMPNRQQMTV